MTSSRTKARAASQTTRPKNTRALTTWSVVSVEGASWLFKMKAPEPSTKMTSRGEYANCPHVVKQVDRVPNSPDWRIEVP